MSNIFHDYIFSQNIFSSQISLSLRGIEWVWPVADGGVPKVYKRTFIDLGRTSADRKICNVDWCLLR